MKDAGSVSDFTTNTNAQLCMQLGIFLELPRVCKGFDTVGERHSRETHDAQPRIVKLRRNGFVVDRQPHLEGSLGRQTMKS